MRLQHMGFAILAYFFIIFVENVIGSGVQKYEMLMPGVKPHREELYLCTPIKVVPNKTYYIIGFEPNATMNKIHHMILFGCSVPGRSDPYWDCGEMAVEQTSDGLEKANPCHEGSHVLYAWARNAKELELPYDVGFQVGAGTQIAYLVLQVHYAIKFPTYYRDYSGINLIYTETPQSKLAGVLLLATGGLIAPHSDTNMESFCKIEEDKVLHPFAFRTHTHSLGKLVSGYVARAEYGQYRWTLLGKKNPLEPQMFYNTFSTEPIIKGDVLASRCQMHSERDRVTAVGPTNNDEMCNFYLMYYVENGDPLEMQYCITEGPPVRYLSNSKYKLNNIPEI